MERAATRFTESLERFLTPQQPVTIFCGMGNNGGDGLVSARLLSQRGYQVRVLVVILAESGSADFQTNLVRLNEAGIQHLDVRRVADVPALASRDTIVDAVFGSGLTRPVTGLAAEVIERINASGARVFSIDLPSGLFADTHSPEPVIRASRTFTFQLPKLSFMMPENSKRVGDWHVVDIALHPKYYGDTETLNFFTAADDLKMLYHARDRFSHKGTLGHALMIAGSKGMMGAAVLTTRAALRAGAGLVTAFVPRVGYDIIQEAVPEAMALTSEEQEILSGSPFESHGADRFDSIGVGPGIGTAGETQEMVSALLEHWKKPLVIDADAINLIAAQGWLNRVPANSVLTPHPGEFKRLAGDSADDFTMLERQRELSRHHQLYIVLKRAYTCITFPDGTAHFNSSGSPALATAGSGDVLTGILTALLAQGYSPADATRLGVWLHGTAGELAAEALSVEAVIAGDIIENLGVAFRTLA